MVSTFLRDLSRMVMDYTGILGYWDTLGKTAVMDYTGILGHFSKRRLLHTGILGH